MASDLIHYFKKFCQKCFFLLFIFRPLVLKFKEPFNFQYYPATSHFNPFGSSYFPCFITVKYFLHTVICNNYFFIHGLYLIAIHVCKNKADFILHENSLHICLRYFISPLLFYLNMCLFSSISSILCSLVLISNSLLFRILLHFITFLWILFIFKLDFFHANHYSWFFIFYQKNRG